MSIKWEQQQAWEWYNAQPWMVGFNFLPQTAVNSTDMWQESTFDIQTIDRELKAASEIGYNTCRVFLQYLVWKHDTEGYKKRIDLFMSVASKYGIKTMPILFDDCNFAENQSFLGEQNPPLPGVHNSQWTSSPNFNDHRQIENLPSLERYVKDIVTTFKNDERIILWDLYNEPQDKSTYLIRKVFEWARECSPTHPLTSGSFMNPHFLPDHISNELSDIVSIHAYNDAEAVRAIVDLKLNLFGRPVIITEWLIRRDGNDFYNLLPYFKSNKIGCVQWGLFAGKTQTYLSWNRSDNPLEGFPKQWQHDIFYPDGTPYDAEEIEFVKKHLRND